MLLSHIGKVNCRRLVYIIYLQWHRRKMGGIMPSRVNLRAQSKFIKRAMLERMY